MCYVDFQGDKYFISLFYAHGVQKKYVGKLTHALCAGKRDYMEESRQQPKEQGTRQLRGLYSKVKISVRTLNIIIVVLAVMLVACMAYAIAKGGFRVSFDTQGGTPVEMQSGLQYGEQITPPGEPTREGFVFDGWYLDPEGTLPWDVGEDVVTETMTLYAKWREK